MSDWVEAIPYNPGGVGRLPMSLAERLQKVAALIPPSWAEERHELLAIAPEVEALERKMQRVEGLLDRLDRYALCEDYEGDPGLACRLRAEADRIREAIRDA